MKRLTVVFSLLLLFVTGCGFLTKAVTGPTQTTSESIPLDTSTEGKIDLHFGVGELTIHSGTSDFFEGDFNGNNTDLQPKINYKVTKDVANLSIKPKKSGLNMIGNIKNEWILSFTDKIPLSFQLKLGVGENNLHFENIHLKDLAVNSGVGETTINFTGVANEGFDVQVKSGVGKTKLIFSKEDAVIITVNKGIGEVSANGFQKDGNTYQTDVESDKPIQVTVKLGIGEVVLEAK